MRRVFTLKVKLRPEQLVLRELIASDITKLASVGTNTPLRMLSNRIEEAGGDYVLVVKARAPLFEESHYDTGEAQILGVC